MRCRATRQSFALLLAWDRHPVLRRCPSRPPSAFWVSGSRGSDSAVAGKRIGQAHRCSSVPVGPSAPGRDPPQRPGPNPGPRRRAVGDPGPTIARQRPSAAPRRARLAPRAPGYRAAPTPYRLTTLLCVIITDAVFWRRPATLSTTGAQPQGYLSIAGAQNALRCSCRRTIGHQET